MQTNEILLFLDDPNALENIYQTKQSQFLTWLDEATDKYPESETLRVWKARLAYSKSLTADKSETKIFYVILIALFAGTLVKLHGLWFVNEDWYLKRFVSVIVIGSLISYFLSADSTLDKRIPILGVLLCITVLILIPNTKDSQSIIMALLHMPYVMLSLLAFTFMHGNWQSSHAKLLFVRYLGEMLIYASIILLGGIVLTLLTYALFSLIHIRIEEWYMSYVVVYGLVASPVVATYIYDVVLGRESRLATIIANIFSPLVLITVCAYLLVIISQGKSPYSDRDFLITINGLLLIVLAITVYSVAGKNSKDNNSQLLDGINIGLVTVTLLINIYALSAIVFRWAEYGVTPNRLAVAGANVLIFVHLLLILKDYIAHIRQQATSQQLLNTVANYLPLYSAWSALMVIGLPLAFGFV
ncbi:hypothetical protein [Methylomonas sp. AM2-LC]|uniref:hypothetical protein n=1 Tax=Methylomonas sp. AM2-LC TaxID=3153301 RepID=UPI003263CD2E